jgi:hypothetical protein
VLAHPARKDFNSELCEDSKRFIPFSSRRVRTGARPRAHHLAPNIIRGVGCGDFLVGRKTSVRVRGCFTCKTSILRVYRGAITTRRVRAASSLSLSLLAQRLANRGRGFLDNFPERLEIESQRADSKH